MNIGERLGLGRAIHDDGGINPISLGFDYLANMVAPGVNQYLNLPTVIQNATKSKPAQPSKPNVQTHGGGTQYFTQGGRPVYSQGGVVYDRATGRPLFNHKGTDRPFRGGYSLVNGNIGVPHQPVSADRQPAPETSVEKPGGGGGEGGGSTGVGPSNTETRVNQNNVTQTGRNLGKINITPSAGVADFTGPSFPTQAATNQISAPYSNTTPEGLERVDLGEGTFGFANKNGRIMGLEGDPAQVPNASVQLPDTVSSSYETFGPNDPRFADAFGEDLARSLGGTSRYGDSGAERPKKSGGRRRSGDIRDRDIDARGGFDPRSDRRGGSEPESTFKPADYAISGQEARRRAAFLSSDGGSLGGIQAVDDGLGRKRAGGKTYFAVNGEYREVDSDKFRELGQIDQSEVDAWRSNWMKDNIKPESTESVNTGKGGYSDAVPDASSAQQPATAGAQVPSMNFKQASEQPRINDFTVNNNITPQYGAQGNKGYDSFGNPPKLNTIKPNDFKMNNNIWGG